MSEKKPEGPTVGPFGARPSKCADESRRAEQERIWAMTPRERMMEALRLGRRRRALEEMRKGMREPKP